MRRWPADLAEEIYGTSGRPAELILRAATNPATTSGTGWIDDLVVGSFADFLVGIAPISAAAAVISRGLRASLSPGHGVLTVPILVTKATDAGGWTAEGAPIPAGNLSFSAISLVPKKLAVINTFTHEVVESSGVENAVRQVLGEAMALQLDTELFSTNPGNDTRPGGLLVGVSALGAKAGGGAAAFIEDVKTLADALTTNGGGGDFVLVASPATAAAAKGWASTKFDVPILASSVVAKNTLMAVETGAFVSVLSPIPEFSVSTQGLLHENTVPLPIVDGSSTVAAGTRSLYQTATIGLRTIVRLDWGMRAGGLVQQITGVSW